jgi:dihydrofolate synthase / folylpolyglutamate synthase
MCSASAENPRREAALRFLVGRIDYERTQSMPCSEEAMKLDRMRELLDRLGRPQDRIPIVHVAGTKGKGSTSAMIAAVLSAAGLRTGLFTSPHLDRVEERIVVDGRPCTGEELADLVERIRPHVQAMDRAEEGSEGGIQGAGTADQGPTYFEIITAMAIDHFHRQNVDAAVLEVGLGGRLDSTNVCSPCVSIITSISFDHTKQLGETLAAIATEKAGIIKPGVPVISGVDVEEPREVIRRIAKQNGCRLVELGVDFDFDYRPPSHLEQGPSSARIDFRHSASGCLSDVAIGLLGRHQATNAAVALAGIEELRRNGWTIPEPAIRRGLAEVVWPARVEIVARRPTVVLDAAHNVASIAALVEVLGESFSARRRLLIFATTQEKDHRGMLQRLLGHFDRVIFTRYSNNPRSVPPEDLLTLARELGRSTGSPEMEIIATPSDAWEAVRRTATPDDLICITGSFFLASEMRNQISERPFRSE